MTLAGELRIIRGSARRVNNVDAVPYRTVLNALRPLYPMAVLAERTGVSRYELTRISLGQMQRIWPRTAAKLRATLPQLCDGDHV